MTIVGESLCTFHVPKTNSHDYALRESHDFEFLRADRRQNSTAWNCPDNFSKKACTFHVGKPICRDKAPANCRDKKFLRQKPEETGTITRKTPKLIVQTIGAKNPCRFHVEKPNSQTKQQGIVWTIISSRQLHSKSHHR